MEGRLTIDVHSVAVVVRLLVELFLCQELIRFSICCEACDHTWTNALTSRATGESGKTKSEALNKSCLGLGPEAVG